jgi:hypothetical protein
MKTLLREIRGLRREMSEVVALLRLVPEVRERLAEAKAEAARNSRDADCTLALARDAEGKLVHEHLVCPHCRSSDTEGPNLWNERRCRECGGTWTYGE